MQTKMRTNLQPFNGMRMIFRATIARWDVFKTKQGMRTKVLLKDLRDVKNKPLEGHVSIADPVSVRDMRFLDAGDLIQFTAAVYEYVKGYKGDNIELRMNHPISIDYGLWDIRDIAKLNFSPTKSRNVVIPSVDALMKNGRIMIGVCL